MNRPDRWESTPQGAAWASFEEPSEGGRPYLQVPDFAGDTFTIELHEEPHVNVDGAFWVPIRVGTSGGEVYLTPEQFKDWVEQLGKFIQAYPQYFETQS